MILRLKKTAWARNRAEMMSEDCVCIEIERITRNDFFNITRAFLLGMTSPLILTRTSCIPNVGSCPAGRRALHSTDGLTTEGHCRASVAKLWERKCDIS